jgi:hypothetical protein
MNENIEVTSLVVHFNNAQDCIAVVESLLNLSISKHKIVVPKKPNGSKWCKNLQPIQT